MNEFIILRAIERAPHDHGKWDKLANKALDAWIIGDVRTLRKIGKRALRYQPCPSWRSEIRLCLDELDRK